MLAKHKMTSVMKMKHEKRSNASEGCCIIIQDACLFHLQGLCTKCIFLVLFCIWCSHRILRRGWTTQRSMALWSCHLELGSSTFPRTLRTSWQGPSPGCLSVLSGGKVSAIWLSVILYAAVTFPSKLEATDSGPLGLWMWEDWRCIYLNFFFFF